MKLGAFLTLLLLVSCQAGTAQRTPILVELFTSEGCSSCPPADQFLIQLQQAQPLEGAEIITLGEHVDYWNRLGWKDPYSSADFSLRQQQYAEALRNEGPYTPQMIVDGRSGFVGTDARSAQAALAAAARTRKATVRLARTGDRLSVRVEDAPPVGRGDTTEVLLAITEDHLATNVARGENAGRKLSHGAVVRKLTVLGRVKADGFAAEPALSLDKNWKLQDLRAVVFVQERGSRRVLGAATLSLAAE